MSRGKNFLIYWLPALAWMCLIYSASADAHSSVHSSRIIEPILRWLFPLLAQETIDEIVFLVRKCAHLTEYAILGLLLWRALRKPARPDPRPWSWRLAGVALLLTALYASSDELHQAFVPTREGRFHDVVIDSTGAALGLLGLWALGKWRDQRGGKPTTTAPSTLETSG